MDFEILGELRAVETIASGHGIHILERLVRLYGKGNWRKLKGFCGVRLPDGTRVRQKYIGSRLTESANAA